ncbi:MAG: lasso peptide biosynthesis B2 protein [Methanobacteriaceae archaeon]|nr:lasso peptide biosynthesis B2 protein [Methanobacteriaceae archaeon]
MNPLTSFLKLSGRDKKLIIKTFLVMLKIRIILWIFPFKYMQEHLARSPKIKAKNNNIKAEHVSWAVNAVSIYLPGSTCLTRALTGYQLLADMNYESQVKIGVGRDSQGEFEAHAWLETDNKIIIGKSEKEYRYLLDLDKRG